MEFIQEDFTAVNQCPWCGSTLYEKEYITEHDCLVVRCSDCSFVYAKKILSELGLQKYWKHYLSQVHRKEEQLNIDRLKMYQLEYDYISQFMTKKTTYKILDIGCADGLFLDCFEGHDRYGVEFGEEAATKSGEKYPVWLGTFPNLSINHTFDLILFRGTIQYFINPKSYFKKAIDLLNPGGMIYITSSPNADAYCFRLFKENFSLPVCITDYFAFTSENLISYFMEMGLQLKAQKYFYTETPYANVENDILRVAEAINQRQNSQPISGRSPAFFDNMLTLVFEKPTDSINSL